MPGAPLQRLSLLRPQEGESELSTRLSLMPVRLDGPNMSFVTRSLNGTVPGPALGVPPGGRLRILMENRLSRPLGLSASINFHHPNTTNLHTHGLHVSPLPPGDDVLTTTIQPGDSWHYDFDLIEEHSPGTYWVHPHTHGAALLQSAAGAALPLIVLDPPGFLSPQLESMEDVVLMLQCVNPRLLEQAATTAGDHLLRFERWNWPGGEENWTGGENWTWAGPEMWLVNGAPEPVLQAKAGRWQRLRLVVAGVHSFLNLEFGACEAALLAKDGVYIQDFPRPVPRVMLPPGGRADVVVRCPTGEHFIASAPSPVAGVAEAFQGLVFSITAQAPPTGAPAQGLDSADLLPWAPASTPPYLRDLRRAEPECSCSTSMGLGGNGRWIAGHLWAGKGHYMHRSPRNAVIERRLSGVDVHPYHAHNYPFQLVTEPDGDEAYFRAGDWHDTYLNVMDSRADVRFHTMDVDGPQVVHCHNPKHADEGMMAVEMVEGFGPSACGCDLMSIGERLPILP